MCKHIIKSGEQCKIQKVNEYGFCCRHINSRQATNINNDVEHEEIKVVKENVINIKKKNSNTYDELYEKQIEEEPICEDENVVEEQVEKKPATQAEIKLIKYGYLAIIGWTEMMFPDRLQNAKSIIEKDAMIDEILTEVANEYSDILGLAGMDPGLKLCAITAMTLGGIAAINSRNMASPLPSINNDNDKYKKLDDIEQIEKMYGDI